MPTENIISIDKRDDGFEEIHKSGPICPHTVIRRTRTVEGEKQRIANGFLPDGLRKRTRRMQKDSIMASLGLTKVRGAVSGRVYYE